MSVAKSTVALLVTSILCGAGLVRAQDTIEKTPIPGIFGPRVVGDSVAPRPSAWAGGLIRGPSGDLLGRGRGAFGYPAPWQYYQPVTPMASAPVYVPPDMAAAQAGIVQPIQQALPANPAYPVSQAPEGQPPATWFRSAGAENAGAPAMAGAEQAAAPAAAAAPPPIYRLGPPASRSPAATGVPAPPPQLSTSLSQRITRIARSGGVQSPTGISVYVGSGSAVLRGTVGTPNDRELVANLVRLEPRVWSVDNQLTVQPGSASR